LLGGSVGIKSIPEYKEIWNAIKSGKIRPNAIACFGAYIYLEGYKMGVASEQLQGIYNNYFNLHKNDPANQKGVYIITSVMTIPSSGSPSGSKVIMTSHYYDIKTKNYLGNAKFRY
jgi:hypothetical protein